MSRYQDPIIAVLLLGFAGFFAYQASIIPEELLRRSAGIAYYPLLLSAALGAASLLLLIKSLVRPGGASEAVEEDPGRKEPERETERGPAFTAGVLPVLLGVVILALYVVALSVVGFIVSTPVMLVALLLAYGVRDWKVIASLSIGTTTVIFLVFYYALKIALP